MGQNSVVGRMQAVEEVIDEAADFHNSADAGVLPPDGGVTVQQRLEKELKSARLQLQAFFSRWTMGLVTWLEGCIG